MIELAACIQMAQMNKGGAPNPVCHEEFFFFSSLAFDAIARNMCTQLGLLSRLASRGNAAARKHHGAASTTARHLARIQFLHRGAKGEKGVSYRPRRGVPSRSSHRRHVNSAPPLVRQS